MYPDVSRYMYTSISIYLYVYIKDRHDGGVAFPGLKLVENFCEGHAAK